MRARNSRVEELPPLVSHVILCSMTSPAPPGTPAVPLGIGRLTIDYERRVHRVEQTDGSQHEEPLSEGIAERAGGIRRLSFGVAERKLIVTLPAGDDVVLEIGAPGERDLPPVGRPVVYLDQNHWVLLSQELWAPAKVGRLDDRRRRRR